MRKHDSPLPEEALYRISKKINEVVSEKRLKKIVDPDGDKDDANPCQ